MTEEGGNPNPNPNPEPQNNNDDDVLGKFKEIKDKYETEIENKDKEIAELKEQLKKKDTEVNDTINDLNDEVKEKLAQAEKMKELQSTVDELVQDKAEATVDRFIQEGKILPAQRDTALKLCLSDNDTFLNLYKDAKPIIEIGTQESKPVPTELVGKMTGYFK